MISYNFFLAKKFIGNRREDRFIWFISAFSVAGITIGVIALILVIGVMNGFSNDLKRKIIGANPLITIEGKPYIYNYEELILYVKKNVSQVKGISPYISSQVIYKSNKYILGGIIKGIDIEREKDVTNIENFIIGSLKEIENGIILGKQLANELEVGIGDYIWVIGGLIPNERLFKVCGIVEYGVYSFDVSMGFTSLKNLMDMFKIKGVHGIGIKIDNIYQTPFVADKIKSILREFSNISVSTWMEKNKILFSAIAVEKKAMAVILSLIILVASFNILSSLMISVYRKVKEIGILKAIGLTSKEIKKIFLYQGIYIGIKGLFFGIVSGLFLAYLVKKYNFINIPEFVYDISKLPIEISFKDIVWISILVISVAVFASIYPSERASKLNPVDAIRNE